MNKKPRFLSEQGRLVVQTAIMSATKERPANLRKLVAACGFSKGSSTSVNIVLRMIDTMRSTGSNIARQGDSLFLSDDQCDFTKEESVARKTGETYLYRANTLKQVIDRLTK